MFFQHQNVDSFQFGLVSSYTDIFGSNRHSRYESVISKSYNLVTNLFSSAMESVLQFLLYELRHVVGYHHYAEMKI